MQKGMQGRDTARMQKRCRECRKGCRGGRLRGCRECRKGCRGGCKDAEKDAGNAEKDAGEGGCEDAGNAEKDAGEGGCPHLHNSSMGQPLSLRFPFFCLLSTFTIPPQLASFMPSVCISYFLTRGCIATLADFTCLYANICAMSFKHISFHICDAPDTCYEKRQGSIFEVYVKSPEVII